MITVEVNDKFADMVEAMLHHLSVFFIPMAMLAFADVRQVLRQAPQDAFRYLQARCKGQQTEDLQTDIQTLSMDSKDEHRL